MATTSSGGTVAGRDDTVTSQSVETRNVTGASRLSTASQSTVRAIQGNAATDTAAAAAAVDEDRLLSTSMIAADDSKTAVAEITTEMLATDDDTQSSSTVAIAVGVTVTVAVILIIIIVLIFFIIRRRQIKRREKNIMKVENPQYKSSDEEERRLTLEKATLSVAPTVKFTPNNNAALINASNTANSRKRKDAPLPPTYSEPPADVPISKDGKRAAPFPPTGLHLELYEKDSPAISTEDLTVVGNSNCAISPSDESFVSPTGSSQLQPLIPPADSNKQSSHESAASAMSRCPSRPPSAGGGDVFSRSSGQTVGNDTKILVSGDNDHDTDADDDIGCADDLSAENQRVALLGKKAVSNLSLDSYDKTKNPFFAGS